MPHEEPRKQLSLVVSIPQHRIHVVGMVVCDERVPEHESPEAAGRAVHKLRHVKGGGGGGGEGVWSIVMGGGVRMA